MIIKGDIIPMLFPFQMYRCKEVNDKPIQQDKLYKAVNFELNSKTIIFEEVENVIEVEDEDNTSNN